jgi:uncharacterized protein YndB with AHSA1/START domain/DNA-binding transcriptional ArsR family regulator
MAAQHHAWRTADLDLAGDDVFKALADPSRRLLLDSLFLRDGQTLGELAARLPAMTRFGVMKHLRQLESAGLISSRKVGREKLHYLNPVPIRLIHDRWIGKYAEPWVGALAALKTSLEAESPLSPRHAFQIYIRSAPETLWQAITDPAWKARYAYWNDDIAIDGEVLAIDPPHTLVQSWSFRHDPDLRDDPSSRVTWQVEPLPGGTCKLTLVHDGFADETRTFHSVGSGWPRILSSLKSLLETGTALPLTG